MHVITRKRLLDFSRKHPSCRSAIESWYRIIKFTDFRNFVELRAVFPSADQVGNFTVFNVGGSKARLVVAIHYNTGKIYVRHVLTHKEYDKGAWKEE
nr:type II toxin-antitoxin system HigB family toxin [Desulfobulbaceae bacterium]